jgi:hypothetical protein
MPRGPARGVPPPALEHLAAIVSRAAEQHDGAAPGGGETLGDLEQERQAFLQPRLAGERHPGARSVAQGLDVAGGRIGTEERGVHAVGHAVQAVTPPGECGGGGEDFFGHAEERVRALERPRQEGQPRPVEHRAVHVVAAQRDAHGHAGAARDPRGHVSRVDRANAVHDGMPVVREQEPRGTREDLQRLVGVGRAPDTVHGDAGAFLHLDARRRQSAPEHDDVEALHARRERGGLARRRDGDAAVRRRKPLGDDQDSHVLPPSRPRSSQTSASASTRSSG